MKKKRNIPAARMERIEVASKYYALGYSYRKIAEAVKRDLNLASYSTRTVFNDVTAISDMWKDKVTDNMDVRRKRELAVCDIITNEAMEGWIKSKELNKGVGNSDFLNVINTQNVERRKLLGLYAAKQVELKQEQPIFPTIELNVVDEEKLKSEE